MTTAMFIVIFARSKWWIDLNGKAKGPFLSRESAERSVALSQEILAITQKTAESLNALLQEQRQAANDAVAAPVAAAKKVSK